MAQFFDGYEQFRTIESPTETMTWAGYKVRGQLSAGSGRLPSSIGITTLNSAYERDWTWAGDTLTVGFACKQIARGPLFGLKVGDTGGRNTNFMLVYIDPVSALVTIDTGLDRSDVGYVTPLPNRWYYYEVVMNRATRVVQVFVNGKADVEFQIPVELTSAPTVRMVFNPYDMMPTNWPEEKPYIEDTKIFDDMYAQDGGRYGAIQISGRLPSGDRAKEWGTSAADVSGPHYLMVGVLPPDVNDRFIYTGTNDRHDSFISGGTLPDDGAILSHGVVALVRKATADPVSVIANIDGNTVTMSNISRAWEYRYTLMSPNGYDKAGIEAAEFGVRSVI